MLARPILIALCCYLFTLGATFNGVFLPEIATLTLPLMGVLLGVWLVLRWRGKWTWYRSPLDAALMLWGAAIALSLLANSGDWRRILIGVWYVLLYMLLWYILSDLLGNNALRRSMLVDALLVAGAMILAFGYWQIITVVVNGWRYPGFFGLPRPGSIVGNPNSLAAMLVVMIGFAGGRLLSVSRPIWRLVLIVYLMLTLVMLFLTYSRGGWLGGAAAVAVVFILWLAQRGLLSISAIRERFSRQSQTTRAAILGVSLAMVTVIAVLAVVLLGSFNESGRSAELRTYLWNTALTMFTEKPISGHGLFTFGKGLQRLNSMPPITPHSHAHNLPLNVLAELGLLGAAALVISIGAAGWAMRQNWNTVNERERGVLIAGIAGVIGFGVHHLFDTPMMMPSIALAGLLALVVAVAPVQPIPMVWAWRRWGHGLAIAGLGIALVVSGWWSSRIYAQYYQIIQTGVSAQDYAGTAQRLQTVIDADATLAVYHWQQGMFYGLDASVNNNPDSARFGIEAFERFVQSEPQNAVGWANLGALRLELGDQTGALAAFARASLLAPDSWQLALAWGTHALQAGNEAMGRSGFTKALEIEPSLALHPVFQTDFGQSLTAEIVLTGLPEIIRLYLAGELESAAALWDSEPIQTIPGDVVRALIALEQGEHEAGLGYLSQAEQRIYADETLNLVWLRLGQAKFNGGTLDEVRNLMLPDLLEADYAGGINIGRSQFLRDVLPRMFLPEVGYETADPLLSRLMSED